jgi:hypothetical protein
MPCKDTTSRILLVEGKNDCHVVMALRGINGMEASFGVYECGSDEQVVARMNALILAPSRPEIIGVVLDADANDVGVRWTQIVDRLRAHQYACPAAPHPEGTLVTPPLGLPSIGIWLMPDNQNRGMLEDFLLSTVERKSLMAVRAAILFARMTKTANFKSAHKSKAIIHTYLAWQDEPGKPLGTSVTARALKPDTPLAIKFVTWLRELFPAVPEG